MIEHAGSTTFMLIVTGIDPPRRGTRTGHTCTSAHASPARGPTLARTTTPSRERTTGVSDQTEVWLDVTINAGGVGVATTTVPFVPLTGDRSVVIHQEPTSPTGGAGGRQACLPVTIA